MSQKYFTTLTNIGAALHANAQLQQTTVPWTHLVLGDGNGVEPVPNPAQTGVIHEVDRLAISSIAPDPDNPNWIIVEAVIPADRGGYVVRETALMGGADGNSCIAVGNYPSATKPLLSDGAGSELIIRVVVEVAYTATVTLKIDPAIVIASRDWVQKQEATEEQAKQGSTLGRWMSPLRVLQLLRESAAQATELLRGTLRVASSDDMQDGDCDDAAVTPQKLITFNQPSIAGNATLTGIDNKLVMTNIVPGIKLEKGDVIEIEITSLAYKKLHTVESIINPNELIVNYEHCGSRGNGSLKLPDYTGQVTINRVAKWFNAPTGLGQAFVSLSSKRTYGVDYYNTSGRSISISITGSTTQVVRNLFVDDVKVGHISPIVIGSAASNVSVFATIPPGSKFSFVGSLSLQEWGECR